jgi:hypothetical protein
MQSTIATLDVIVSDGVGDPLGEYSTGLLPPREGNHFKLTIRPKIDAPILANIKEPLNRQNMETLLAHELGHFVAILFSDPTHDRTMRLLSVILNDSTLNLQAEAKAWELGEIIKPKLNKRIEHYALSGYATNGANGAKTEVNG